jgi:hypothetical protein
LNYPGGRRENEFKRNLKLVVWNGINWTELAHDRDRWNVFVNAVMNLQASSNAENFLTS